MHVPKRAIQKAARRSVELFTGSHAAELEVQLSRTTSPEDAKALQEELSIERAKGTLACGATLAALILGTVILESVLDE